MSAVGLVLDTNVVVSAHLEETGFERFVLGLALNSIVRLYVTAEIMQDMLKYSNGQTSGFRREGGLNRYP